MIYIYYSYLSEENHESLLNTDLLKFSIDYQQKIKRYRRWQDAQLSLLGRLLLLKGIEDIYSYNYQGKEMKYTIYNKPYFEDNLVQFNISHSDGIVVCALSEIFEIGIDIEKISNIEINDFKSQMSEKEWSNIVLSRDKKVTFFDYWTQKEAVIKAHGNGLSIPLISFEILDDKTNINEELFFLKEIKIDKKYKCHISLKTNINEVFLKKINYKSNN